MGGDEDWTKKLSCPQTWTDGSMPCIPIPKFKVGELIDEMEFSKTPWHHVVEMVNVAYSHATHKRQCDAASLIKECYMYVLPRPFCQHSCHIVREYRLALRHVLDSFWAFLVWGRSRAMTPLLRHFVDAITPFRHLSAAQQAAVHAMRAHINQMMPGASHGLLHMCLELNPHEGEWHSMMGNDWRGGVPADQRLWHLRRAHQLRPGPHTGLDLARTLADDKDTRAEALRLVRETLDLYPDHPHVLYSAGYVLIRASGKTKESMKEAEKLLLRCIEVVGDRNLIRDRLADVCGQQGGRDADVRRHAERANQLTCKLNRPQMRVVSLDELCASMAREANEGF